VLSTSAQDGIVDVTALRTDVVIHVRRRMVLLVTKKKRDKKIH